MPIPEIRVGQGYDSHRLVGGRPLILGGVTIPFEKGLDGHSDADVLLHAVTDAVLGAASLGDIGTHFPPSDPKWKGADSGKLLAAVMDLAQAAGWQVVNLDATVICERPKLGALKEQIRSSQHQSEDKRKDGCGRPRRRHDGARDGTSGQGLIRSRQSS